MPKILKECVHDGSLLDKHLDAPRGERIFDVPGQKPLRFLLLPQYGIQVAKRESTHEYVRL